MKEKTYNLLAFFILGIVGFLCYSNNFKGAFVFDDLSTIVYSTAYLEGFSSIKKIWLNQPFRFLPNLSFAINYYFGRFNVIGFHLVNFFIHTVTAYIIFVFTRLVVESELVDNHYSKTTRLSVPIVSSLLFLSHPIQTQTVSYITQRTASMAALFYMLSIVLYIKSAIIRKKQANKNPFTSFQFAACYTGAIVSGLFAMFSKENAFSLPLAILLVEYFFFTTGFQRIKQKLTLLAPFVLLAFYIYFSRGFTINFRAGVMGGVSAFPTLTQRIEITRWQYFLTQTNVVRTYVRLLFFPAGQNLDYDYPISQSIFDMNTMLSCFFLLFLIILAFLIFRKSRLISFGIFFFFTTLLIESSIVPLDDVIMEHRLYLPSVGFVLAVAASFFSIYTFFEHYFKKKERNYALLRFFSIVLIFLIIGVSSFLTYQRNKVWKDDYTLWKDVVSKSPNKSRPHFNLGMAYVNRGDFANGVFQFKKAIEIGQKYWRAYNNLAAAYEALGDSKSAEKMLKLALDIVPDNSFIRSNLADLYYRTGKVNEAIDEFNNGLLINPKDPSLYSNLGLLYYRQGEIDIAIDQFQKSLKLHPDASTPYYYLGVIEANYDRYDSAVDLFNKTLERDPKFVPAIVDLGKIFLAQNKNRKALELFEKALRIDPNSSEAFYHIGLLYLRQGSLDRAEDAFGLSTKKNPYFFQAFNNLGIVLAQIGKKDEAKKAFERALELNPGYKKARNNLKRLAEE